MAAAQFASVTGAHWPGFSGVKKLFIFGDSYSAIGYDTGWPAPNEKEPLGVPFPGYTWAEGGEEEMGDSTNPNWVGHLVTSRLRRKKPLLVYDYAVGGHTLSGVKSQIDLWFLPHVAQKPDWAPWTADESLFITWVGINDCAGMINHASEIQKLFELQDVLYETGARNFMLIDVPPIFQCPCVPAQYQSDPKIIKTYSEWNETLHKGAEEFHKKHPDITLLMYSSWDIFDKVYQDPVKYGFRVRDLKTSRGGIWADFIHPTSKMHSVVAKDMEEFLDQFPSVQEEEEPVVN